LCKLEKFGDVPIGTKVELSVIDPIEGKLNIGFVSQIEGYINADIIRISAPIFEAKVYPVKVNSKIEAYLFFKSNQIYRISGFVYDRLIVDDIALLDVRVTENLQKIQRRQFFRYDCLVPITFYEQQSNGLEDDFKEISGVIIDLSGGGLSALTDEPLNKDIVIKGRFILDDNLIVFSPKLIRCYRNIINNELKYVSSISFIDIGYKERERIVEFIFNQQRLLLKKGLR